MSTAGRPDTAGTASDPCDAVRAWWRAMQQGETDTLERLAAEDYLSWGPDGRTTGRTALLKRAAAFFAEAVVERCAVEDFELRDLGAVAVCSYRWSESGRHRGMPFALAGVATDVLVRRGEGWRYQAHHVSIAAP
jgi:ketosteroid isomerase-like protein